jgi:thymidylate synthase (FAD)
MKVIDQSWGFMTCPLGILQLLEGAGRTCYKSEDKITDESAEGFVRGIIKRGHESVLEHVSISVRIITDRGVTHEIVRHRLASYSQESTRYCNYGKEEGMVTFIRPVWVKDLSHLRTLTCGPDDKALIGVPLTPDAYWIGSCAECERQYLYLLAMGWGPQQARTVLNNSLKTEIVMTCNIREWRHFFRLRTSKAAHPQMRELAQSMLGEFRARFPVVFEDVGEVA